jgi:hypothetical protein
MIAEVLSFMICPSCPTQVAARELFFAEELVPRLIAMVGPFAVTAGLIGLLVGKLRQHERAREDEQEAGS